MSNRSTIDGRTRETGRRLRDGCKKETGLNPYRGGERNTGTPDPFSFLRPIRNQRWRRRVVSTGKVRKVDGQSGVREYPVVWNGPRRNPLVYPRSGTGGL